MAKRNALWAWFDGKKRTVALLYWSIVIPATSVFWPAGAPEAITKTEALIGILLSAVGMTHAAIKYNRTKKPM